MMFDIMNFDSWRVYDGAAEGSGRSEKIWLISDDGKIGLFKYPKIDPQDQKETTEHISEHLAHQLGNILKVPTAKVDLGIREGRIGSMSYLVTKSNEVLVEGIDFMSGKFPGYNPEKMYDEKHEMYYCLEHILASIPPDAPQIFWIQMILFDYLIGNADRHQSNWALLLNFESREEVNIKVCQCPLYDNGSSLCCYVNERKLDLYSGKDTHAFDALVDSKSRSIIRIDGKKKANPKHSDVVRFLVNKYPDSRSIASCFLECLNAEVIDSIMNQYPESILSIKKNNLIRRYLYKKLELLDEILNSEVQNGAAG